MKILFAMTYYRPYVSGPIIYVENLARELAARGHEVTILTSHYDPGLPLEERIGPLRVVRVPVLFRVSKGVIMPSFFRAALRLAREHDVMAIQVPQFEGATLAFVARLAGIPSTMTYHCDVQLPDSLFNRVVDKVVLGGNFAAASMSDRIIAYTLDYATHSPLMSRFLDKVTVIPPPVEMATPPESVREAFHLMHELEGKRVIGICGRFATEKGFEQLIEAIPPLLEEFPTLEVLHAGEFENVIGEQGYRDRLRPVLESYGKHWKSLGVLGGEELAAFFAACDVTVLPSLNRTESFGFVQVESMLMGTPVVASNLPGVRVPVQTTGMGRITPIGDSRALAENLAAVLRDPEAYSAAREAVEREYSAERTTDDYLALYEELLASPTRKPWRVLAALIVAVVTTLGAIAHVARLMADQTADVRRQISENGERGKVKGGG